MQEVHIRALVFCIKMNQQRWLEKRLMAHCACVLGMSDEEKTLRQTRYVAGGMPFAISHFALIAFSLNALNAQKLSSLAGPLL